MQAASAGVGAELKTLRQQRDGLEDQIQRLEASIARAKGKPVNAPGQTWMQCHMSSLTAHVAFRHILRLVTSPQLSPAPGVSPLPAGGVQCMACMVEYGSVVTACVPMQRARPSTAKGLMRSLTAWRSWKRLSTTSRSSVPR